ncbi:UNVERIFIED_CONTAM: hypothetical protein HDU68_012693, partial [Siphonaria sp. JEL0065]
SPIQITVSNASPNRIELSPCASDLSAAEILITSHQAILTCFQNKKCHPHRLIYCTAGRLFFSAAPLPFGGPRINPGYTEFQGKDADELLTYIISAAYKVYWNSRGQAGLNVVVEVVNLVLDWQDQGLKDHLDELLMKGLKKAGHIEWFGPANVPVHLRNSFEDGVDAPSAFFTPRRGIKEEH